MTSTATKTKVPAQSNGKADPTPPAAFFSNPVRDYTTKNGQYTVHLVTVEEYLTGIGVYADGKFDLARIPKSDVQRALIAIGAKNEKDAMLYDVMRGCALPALVVDMDGDTTEVLDGLQRTHVLTVVAIGLQKKKHDPETLDCSAEFERNWGNREGRVQVDPLDFDSFMSHHVTYQRYTGLTEAEKAYKFMKLNVGQQKVSASHLAEVGLKDFRDMFKEWGFETITDKEKKEAPRGRKTTTKGDGTPPPGKQYPLDALLLNLYGYAMRESNPDKKELFADGAADKIRSGLEEVGGEDNANKDFNWLYGELFAAMHSHYDGRFPGIKAESDTFGTPILAALAYARKEGITEEEIQDRKDELIERLAAGDSDPLTMHTGRNGWESLLEEDSLKGSVGVRTRKLTYHGFKQYFLKGKQKTGLPVSWQEAWANAKN